MYNNFTDMPVWRKAMNLSFDVFEITNNLPKSEDYGLTSQIRRSANSVSANISEGYGRNTVKDKCRFYTLARGSAFETQNHLIYGTKVGYFEKKLSKKIIEKYKEVIYDLNKLMKSLR
jgi:four helix bundle protein